MRLLEGVRILAVEQYGAGPYGTMLLAELGAEVIKIEAPSMGGDVSRSVGPYFLGDGDSQFYQTFSRSKKSVALEIKTEQGRADFEKLVRDADAVVNNLRGDQPAKLKITYDDLKAINPSIVCAHLSAYGRDNERAAWPGYDYLMQAEAGFMSVTGEPDAPPTRFGLSMVDFMTGSQMALGCVSAIMKARASGEGCDVDVSLFDAASASTYLSRCLGDEWRSCCWPFAARCAPCDFPFADCQNKRWLGPIDVPDAKILGHLLRTGRLP